jgi:DNA-binding IclR family transcriptional regulator
MVRTRRQEPAVEPPSDRIQSVSRALRVLEAVCDAPAGVAAKVVARRCGLSLSTTYHLLRTLAYEGYLTRLPSGDYSVGPQVADRFRDLVGQFARSSATPRGDGVS